MRMDEILPGDKLIADNGFDCLDQGAVCVVHTYHGKLYVPCREGEHYLSGDVHDKLQGFRRPDVKDKDDV